MPTNRQPAGTPSDGQFAASHHGDADLALDADTRGPKHRAGKPDKGKLPLISRILLGGFGAAAGHDSPFFAETRQHLLGDRQDVSEGQLLGHPCLIGHRAKFLPRWTGSGGPYFSITTEVDKLDRVELEQMIAECQRRGLVLLDRPENVEGCAISLAVGARDIDPECLLALEAKPPTIWKFIQVASVADLRNKTVYTARRYPSWAVAITPVVKARIARQFPKTEWRRVVVGPNPVVDPRP